MMIAVPPLDHDRCYAAAASRDARFDGRFVTAVRTTGIYCRPSCPAVTPKPTNVEFHHTAAAAQQLGFRACRRCRPDATPGSPEWNERDDVVGRAMRSIADGVVEREGVGGLARRIGYSERHLHRLLRDEVGAGPLALARAQRAQTARTLIETTDLRLTDVAFAAGFGSVRQFNETVREVFASSPTELRSSAASRRGRPGPGVGAPGSLTLRLPTRAPFAGHEVLAFLGRRAIPGVETFVDGVYSRVMGLPGGHGVVTLRAGDDPSSASIEASVRLTDLADLNTAVQRVRRLLDLDADPVAVAERLGPLPVLGPLARRAPGRRSPGSVDPFETAVRAIVGQQISVSGARTVTARIVESVGEAATVAEPGLTHRFPTPEALAEAPDDAFAMPTRRRDAIRGLARAVASGEVELDVGADREETRSSLLALSGIGPWTADYVVMRGLGHPDVGLVTDLGVVHALRALGVDATRSAEIVSAGAPWRSYVTHHLWASLDAPTEPTPAGPTSTGPTSTVPPSTGPPDRPTADRPTTDRPTTDRPTTDDRTSTA